ncbi:MAG: hypothetical protein HOA96_06800 [Candidatus Marinimicrobia bacterium]|jgi:hypothetical protein|nr:hypothetical protein [Candidatus Neomarinimicrobiota bacterium]
MLKNKILLTLFVTSFLFAQNNVKEEVSFSDYQISSERYLTDEKGNIMMNVNVWGHVGNSGHHLVYEGIDLATLISLVGGPQQGANLKKTRIYREIPDENGQLVYYVNLEDFFKNGDRKNFIKIKPNDTIIIPQSPMSYFLTQVGTFNTVLSLLNLYFQLVK